MSKEINWQKRFETCEQAIAIFDKDLNLTDSNDRFLILSSNHRNLASILDTLFISKDSGVHSWDFEGKNFFVTKECFQNQYILTFIDITNYMEMLDQVIDQRIKIISDAKIDHGNDIVSQVSHSILNPSLIVKANLNQLKKELRDTKSLDRLEKIDQSISRIIDFSQAVSMNLITKGDDKETLSSVIQSIQNYYKEDLNIYGIELILENICNEQLIDSSVKFSIVSIFENAVEELQRKGKDWIKVDFYKSANSSHIAISNSGSLIPMPERSQLFLRPQTNKIDGKHSGFSLYSASNLLEAKGHKISYECSEDIGTFIISFK